MDRLIIFLPVLPVAAAIIFGARWFYRNRRRVREARRETK